MIAHRSLSSFFYYGSIEFDDIFILVYNSCNGVLSLTDKSYVENLGECPNSDDLGVASVSRYRTDRDLPCASAGRQIGRIRC